MHVNYEYLLEIAYAGDTERKRRVLDYGCGTAELVDAGQRQERPFYGCDVFYAATSALHTVRDKGYLGDVVRVMEGGRIPFPDEFFDVVVSNMVLEHVPDLELAISETHRVLKAGGRAFHLFPSFEVFREGHSGIPFVHWLRKDSRFRYFYALFMRALGMGHLKRTRSRREWVDYTLRWLDTFVYYRPRRVVLKAFQSRFSVESVEHDYAAFRLRHHGMPRLAGLCKHPGIRELTASAVRRLGCLALALTKPALASRSSRVS
jgi:SAM-dependent methyltransferase